jgi:hypothetical protein
MLKSTFARACVVSIMAIVGFAASLSATHSWGGYHWARTENPFTLAIDDNVSAAWDGYFNQAVSEWSASSVLDLAPATGTANRNCKPKAGRVEVCNAAYGFNGWLGIAQIWITGGVHITQGTTKMNDSYFNTATYNSGAWRNLVMCQEVGHTFGLAHQDEDFDNANLGSCMDYTNSPSSNQYPNGHDYQELEFIYAHLDSTNTASATRLPLAMPPAMGLIDLDNPRNWGRSVARSANGRQETFELDFGSGNKVVTEVFWADPDSDAHVH